MGNTTATLDRIEHPETEVGRWHGDEDEPWFFSGPAYSEVKKFQYCTNGTCPANYAITFQIKEGGTVVYEEDLSPHNCSQGWETIDFTGRLHEDTSDLDTPNFLSPGKLYTAIILVTDPACPDNSWSNSIAFRTGKRSIYWADTREATHGRGALHKAVAEAKATGASISRNPASAAEILYYTETTKWRDAYKYNTVKGKMQSWGHGSPGLIKLEDSVLYAGFGEGTNVIGYSPYALDGIGIWDLYIYLFHCFTCDPNPGSHIDVVHSLKQVVIKRIHSSNVVRGVHGFYTIGVESRVGVKQVGGEPLTGEQLQEIADEGVAQTQPLANLQGLVFGSSGEHDPAAYNDIVGRLTGHLQTWARDKFDDEGIELEVTLEFRFVEQSDGGSLRECQE